MTEYAEHVGYKGCRDGRIVVLEILGINNEEREIIGDFPAELIRESAAYRCSKARVLKIYDMYDKTREYDIAVSNYDKTFEYKLGEIVEPRYFDPDLRKPCVGGIHYYLSEWMVDPFNLDLTIHDNDIPRNSVGDKITKPDGIYRSYYTNGQLCAEWVHKDGKERLYKEWDTYGRIAYVTIHPDRYDNDDNNSAYITEKYYCQNQLNHILDEEKEISGEYYDLDKDGITMRFKDTGARIEYRSFYKKGSQCPYYTERWNPDGSSWKPNETI